MKLIRYISIIVLALTASNSYSQTWTGQAYEFYKVKDYENAKSAIDSAITTIERFDSQTWQLRGIIYRNISSGDQLYYREIALESFVRAKNIDSTGLYTEKVNGYLLNTVVRYYNDAVTLLIDEKEFDKAEESYATYKGQYKRLLDPGFDFRETDINFFNAMGSEYLVKVDLVEPNKKNALREKALFYCEKVLQIDSLDYKANFNAGIVYYNIGADYVMTVDPEITIEKLIMNQKRSEDAFLKALPYLHRSEKLKPGSKEVQEALMGCYYGLNNNEMYLKYQTLVDKQNIQLYLDRCKTHPDDIDNIKQLIRVYTFTLIDEEEAARFTQILNELKK